MRKCRICSKSLPRDSHFNRRHCKSCARKRDAFTRMRAHLKWRSKHPEVMRETRRKCNVRLKNETLSHYGKRGKAICCWRGCRVADIDMLSLDHIENDGKIERTKKNLSSGMGFYGHLRKRGWPKGYQTLCANHQLKKEISRRRKRA